MLKSDVRLLKATENKYDFSFNLKLNKHVLLQISQERLFQNEGAETTKALDPAEEEDLGTSIKQNIINRPKITRWKAIINKFGQIRWS